VADVEKDVTADQHPVGFTPQSDVPGRVAGDIKHSESSNLIAFT
jgi:hypothetical protein